MLPKRFVVPFAVALSLCAVTDAQDREELLATPKIEEDARQPTFKEFTAEHAAAAITMVAGRNYAWFGFNTPEIRLVLPDADNSVYADVEFGEATLFDADGREVPYERELGLYDHDTHHTEIRFAPSDGDEPVDYARAVGTVIVRYPLRLHTFRAQAGGPAVEGLDIDVDGPFVTRRSTSDDQELEAAAFTGITAFRAVDDEGRTIERYPSSSVSVVDGTVTETLAYWGEVAAIERDVADEWALIRVTYELPSVAPLPKERAGIAPDDGDENPPTPGARISVEVVEETPGMLIAAELGLSPEEALEQLRARGYPEPSADFMVMSALQGNRDMLELFLAAGFPIDYQTGDGRTALSSAVMYGRPEIALFLIDAGADVNIADSNNATPLFQAAGKCDQTEVVRALLAAGADPSPATRGGATAAQMAGIMSCTDNEAAINSTVGD